MRWWWLFALLACGLLGLVACYPASDCPEGLHPFKNGCADPLTINFMTCTEGRGISLEENRQVWLEGGVTGGEGVVDVAREVVEAENAPIARDVVRYCLELINEIQDVPPPQSAEIVEFIDELNNRSGGVTDTSVNRELARLEKANMAFNTPDNLQLGESSTIQLLLSTREPRSTLEGRIEAPGPVEGAQVKVSSTVKASLTGSGFLIEPIAEEVQPVSGFADTEWQWEIIPKRTGIQSLRLTLSALISVEGIERERFIETFSRDIEVRVDKILKPLKEAEIIFDPPKTVEFGESSTAELLVNPQESVNIANRIAARLSGSGFTIEPLTEEIQPVTETGQTVWRWEITPNMPGSHTLHVALSAVIYIADDPTALTFPIGNGQYDKTIKVSASWIDRVFSFIGNNWQWLWTMILIPTIGWAIHNRNKLRNFLKVRRLGAYNPAHNPKLDKENP
jgi:hypothetical protein